MLGDQNDMLLRIKQLLPTKWFPDETPVLDLLLAGMASAWSWVYALLGQVKGQTRISTAEGIWLDMASRDFFGSSLPRRAGEPDGHYKQRILFELVRERGTRRAVVAAVTDLTASPPRLFEPSNTADTGGYGSLKTSICGMAYGIAGGWGSLSLPCQVFVGVSRPRSDGIAIVSGWGSVGGGYNQGALEYASLSMVQGWVTDSDIYAAIAGVLPIGAIAWTSISN